jgi:hypothetical protein
MARRFLGEIRDDSKYWREKLARATISKKKDRGRR